MCTSEMAALSDDCTRFERADTAVLPSVDAVPWPKAFKAQEQMKVDLLSNFKRDVSRWYGTLDEERSCSIRAYILIDRNGVVRWAYAEDTPASRRENAEIVEQITKLN